MGIVFCSHAQDHSIDSFVGLRSGEKLPATAATGMTFTLPHVDVVESEIVILAVMIGREGGRRLGSVRVSFPGGGFAEG